MDAFGRHVPVFRELTSDAGREWLASLPALVAAIEDEWGVRTGPPFLRGTAAWTAPAGETAVLKVGWPHREARHEAEGLAMWAGAVRVLRSDPSRWAMLIERCVPGVALDESGLGAEAAMEAGAAILGQLWAVDVPDGHPFELLGDVTTDWATLVRERMGRHRPGFDSGLVALGASLLETLPAGAGRAALIHGDFNPGNILSADRAPFLAIDPKPMVGDPAYDPSQLLTQLGGASTPQEMLARCRRFAGLVDVPAERILAWGVARSVEGALWDVSEGRPGAGENGMRRARLQAGAGGL